MGESLSPNWALGPAAASARWRPTRGWTPHWPLDATGAPIKRLNIANPHIPEARPNKCTLDRPRSYLPVCGQPDHGGLQLADPAINDSSEPCPSTPKRVRQTTARDRDAASSAARRMPGKRQQATDARSLARRHCWGSPPARLPDVSAGLAEVDLIPRPDGGYEIHYRQRDAREPDRLQRKRVTANVVVVAAGCINTNEILLRSKASGGLPGISDKLGYGFSTNGDSLQFLPRTKEPTYLTRGTMMTSFAGSTSGIGDGLDPALSRHRRQRCPRCLHAQGVGQPLVR
jgi:hypothetical protein